MRRKHFRTCPPPCGKSFYGHKDTCPQCRRVQQVLRAFAPIDPRDSRKLPSSKRPVGVRMPPSPAEQLEIEELRQATAESDDQSWLIR